jgi:hypothetical protein
MDALSTAFDRIDDFVAVQTAARGGITADAVGLLQAAVGIAEEERGTIRERVAGVSPGAHAGSVLLGILVGLLAAQDADG